MPEDNPLMPESTPRTSPELENETRRNFLENQYLDHKYLIPEKIEEELTAAASELTTRYPEFKTLVVVGGVANGSYLLRAQERGKDVPTDLDFYLVGNATTQSRLEQMAQIVANHAADVNLVPDPLLNGRRMDHYLNLDDLDGHIEREELDLLALPFQATMGEAEPAQQAVLEALLSRPDKQSIWDEIANYHTQSLSLHHGSWDPAFSDAILDRYYPKKIQRFDLPETPEEYYSQLKKH